ncbi:MAG TPA: NADPH:quinone oxidoreductase family protein [Solirubrobacteraceae bacterium]|nr:NADPH:quinone oxidoreductase family protein [Solirubrobacteraceae bacterium]
MPSASMRAIQMTEFGGPEVLRPTDLAVPEPGPDEVLIEVALAGVNFADTHTRTDSYVRKAALPLVPGGEVTGTIVRAPVGARVGLSGPAGARPAKSAHAAGELREGMRVVALTGTGGYAQYATAPAAHAFPIPDEVDDETALALVVQGTTAWHLYRTAARVADRESVVVHSAAGGVGSLAVQLGHALGAGRVIATASSLDRRELALGLGADVAIGPAPEGLTERLIEANGGDPVDVVFDMAGGDTFEVSYRALAPFGRIVVCGISSQQPNRISTGSLLRHSRSIVGFYLFHVLERRPDLFVAGLADLLAMVARGELRAIVGATYALGDAAQAHVDLRSRRTTGKLLLDPWA